MEIKDTRNETENVSGSVNGTSPPTPASQNGSGISGILSLIPIILLIILAVWYIFINPHNYRKNSAINAAKTHTAYLPGKNFEHADDYKGFCIISFDVYSDKYYFAADLDSYITAPSKSLTDLKSAIDRNT